MAAAKAVASVSHLYMEKLHVILALGVLLATSCSVGEKDSAREAALADDTVFWAELENSSDARTRVYADEKLRVLWDADDRVSIFNRYTYNQEYSFTGKTGDNAGAFRMVPSEDFVTGNAQDLIYSVYPYAETTAIDNDGVLSLVLPASQHYRENSFGRGDNTMVSCTTDNQLLYRNLCGYLALRLYGEGVSVSSISIRGNNGEPLAGECRVVAIPDGAPSLTWGAAVSDEIHVVADEPVVLGQTPTLFWVVVPPVTFAGGITLTVTDPQGNRFEKTTSGTLTVSRNTRTNMAPLQMVPQGFYKDLSIAEIAQTQDGTLVGTVPSTVMARTELGVIISDGEEEVFVFSRNPLNLSIGDMVRIKATKTTYYGLPELTDVESVELLSSNNPVQYPEPVDISDCTDFSTPLFSRFTYVSMEGGESSWQRGYFGVHYYIDRGDKSYQIFCPSDYQQIERPQTIEILSVKGYFAGMTDDGNTIRIIITEMDCRLDDSQYLILAYGTTRSGLTNEELVNGENPFREGEQVSVNGVPYTLEQIDGGIGVKVPKAASYLVSYPACKVTGDGHVARVRAMVDPDQTGEQGMLFYGALAPLSEGEEVENPGIVTMKPCLAMLRLRVDEHVTDIEIGAAAENEYLAGTASFVPDEDAKDRYGDLNPNIVFAPDASATIVVSNDRRTGFRYIVTFPQTLSQGLKARWTVVSTDPETGAVTGSQIQERTMSQSLPFKAGSVFTISLSN